mmetsp:Transcript_10627/g.31076  ORF Transcript_10627/g.31076 Transcript_10627/m.31076 type:complete len:201 (+) Transcript_10627:192-794(+)
MFHGIVHENRTPKLCGGNGQSLCFSDRRWSFVRSSPAPPEFATRHGVFARIPARNGPMGGRHSSRHRIERDRERERERDQHPLWESFLSNVARSTGGAIGCDHHDNPASQKRRHSDSRTRLPAWKRCRGGSPQTGGGRLRPTGLAVPARFLWALHSVGLRDGSRVVLPGVPTDSLESKVLWEGRGGPFAGDASGRDSVPV